MSLVRTRESLHKLQPLIVGFFIVFVAGIFIQFNPWSSSQAGAGSPATTLARINGQEVPKDVFNQRVRQYSEFMTRGTAIPLEQQASLYQYAWDSILSEYAQAAAAEANGVRVSDSEAQAELDRLIEQQVEQIGAGSAPEEKAEIRAQLAARVDLESQRRSMLAQRLRDKFTREARPVEVKVAHVLIKTDTRAPAQAERLARDIARRARAGEDFGKLASQFSEDPGSKLSGGVAGWASANPPAPPSDPKAKKDPDAATSFVPEFTAAALRLKPGEVSEPVLSTYGWHVIKALEERSYKPEPAKGAKPDAKKDQEALDQYKQQVGDRITQGLFEEYKNRAKVEAVAPWLQGHLAEQNSNKAMMANITSGKMPSASDRLAPAIKAYSQALQQGGIEAGPPLAYKLARMYQEAGQNQEAQATLKDYEGRDPEIEMLRGDILEKLGRKTDALAAYQSASKLAYSNPGVHGQLVDKFKKVGRNDLAEEARKEQARQLALQAEQEKARQAEQQRRQAEMEARARQEAAQNKTSGNAPAGNAPASNAPAGNQPAAP